MTISGITVGDKYFDDTDNAEIEGDFTYSGLLEGEENVAVAGTLQARFATSEPGEDIEIIFSGLSLTGSNAHNYVLVAPNTLQYYWLDQFADEHHYDMNACNDFGNKIGSDIAYYYLNDRTKPNSTTYEETQNMNYGSLLKGLNVVSDHLIAFDDTIDKSMTWLLSDSTYSAYAEIANVQLDYDTNFELEFTLKLGDNLVGVSAGNARPVLGSSNNSDSISVGSNSVILKSGSTNITLAHNVSPIVYRPSSERICKEISHETYKIVKEENVISLYVNDDFASSQQVSADFTLNLNMFGRSGSTHLQGVVSNFSLSVG